MLLRIIRPGTALQHYKYSYDFYIYIGSTECFYNDKPGNTAMNAAGSSINTIHNHSHSRHTPTTMIPEGQRG